MRFIATLSMVVSAGSFILLGYGIGGGTLSGEQATSLHLMPVAALAVVTAVIALLVMDVAS